MTEILKEWLTRRLQTPMKWEAEDIGEEMKNGLTIASILHSYHIINDEKQYLIKSSTHAEDIRRNWKLLRQWLSDVEIKLTDDELKSIMEGKRSSILRLFYQLFLHLDKKDRIDFIKKERKMASKLVQKMENRFAVQRVNDEIRSVEDNLSKPLFNEKHFIDWKRKKAAQVQETYDHMRYKYCKTLNNLDKTATPFVSTGQKEKVSNKDEMDMKKFSLKYPCKFENYSYEELLALEQKTMDNNKYIVNSEWTKEYLKDLYSRMHKKADSEEFQKQISNVISGSLWNTSVSEEEIKVDLALTKKVMKLSQIEKQMCRQIMETKQQARNLVKNRIQAEMDFTDERTKYFNNFLDSVKEEIKLGLSEIDFEKQRQNKLHNKLYLEKMKRKRQHYYEICYSTMLSIIDYATKIAYFKRLIGDDIPNHFVNEWKLLYYKQQPIFETIDPLDNILAENKVDDNDEVEEVIDLTLEKNRQDSLNECEFDQYHNYLPPWSLDLLISNYDSESEERKYEYLGNRILGHVVYTLLEIKYPYPPQRMPAELPTFTSKAVLRNLHDLAITVAIQKLLEEQKIHVVRLESCINYCLRQFKIEMVGCTDIELTFDKFVSNAKEENVKELVKLMKSEDEVINKCSELIMTPFPINAKQTQTPKTIPEDQIILSDAANLGKYTYDALSLGNPLTDHLLAAMIVEYLKNQTGINGFVLINYPNTYQETQILEEIFSGRIPPDETELEDNDDIFLEENINMQRKKERDPFKEKRKSKLTSNPHKILYEDLFNSYFSCYIKLKETEDILQDNFIWDLTKENSEFIDRFYAALGINYSMYYEVIEKEQLAIICKYIIGDCEIPSKSYDALFGENVLSNLDYPTSDDKRAKSKIIKPETVNSKSNNKLRVNSKTSKLSSTNDLEAVKSPVLFKNSKGEINSLKSYRNVQNNSNAFKTSEENVQLLAGEDDWDYGKLPISKTIGIAIASCWKEIERIYLHDMQQLFLSRRLEMNCLVPYTTFIKDKMLQIITLPSQKQDLVCNFQQQYNDFENDWRDIRLTKNEWHCRVQELQNKLYRICDERKKYAEQQRHALVCENWAVEELITLANIFISCMQAELNRSVLTYQTLHDFYYTMLKRLPPIERLVSKELIKISKDTDETSGSKRGGEDKLYRQLKAAYLDLQLRNIDIDNSNNPLNVLIENNVKFTFKTIKEMNDSYRTLISREYSELSKTVPVTKIKDGTVSKESINVEEMYQTNAIKCIDEWTMGINGEMFRLNLRILALQNKCYEDMRLLSGHVFKAFTDIQNNINSYYQNEIKSVDRLCKYLQTAIEMGRKIPESLLLENDAFIIDPNFLQFQTQKSEIIVDETKETICDMDFKIGQLARLRSQLKMLAPTGIILLQAFIYALQDFIFYGKESCEGPIFPALWKRVDPEQVPKLVVLIFGENAFIDWRDFLIYCLNIRFPTLEELFDIRKKFRRLDLESKELLTRDQFMEVELWFEEDYDTNDKQKALRKTLIKHFLFELFEIAENTMNYSALLLALCKSGDPKDGFANALSMAVGKKVCYIREECEDIVNTLIEKKRFRDECRACTLKCSELLLDKILHNVVMISEGTTILELEYVESNDKDKKSKKSKFGSKAKKVESSQSARMAKSNKNLISTSKMAQSVTDVKETCKKCEIEQETKPEEPVPEEEKEEEVFIDPNLAYTVQQSTIWNVLKICLPWYFELWVEDNNYITQLKDVLKELEEFTEEKDIYICKFLSNSNVCKILHKTKKFVALNLVEELLKVAL